MYCMNFCSTSLKKFFFCLYRDVYSKKKKKERKKEGKKEICKGKSRETET